ncbi:member of Set1p complex, histone methyl transferase [Scheffersomyces spartinae]|uniref:Member of Set1p complex, histone methyl transferase n=1 Tax=Scheffersomyces spartinae TaxID=45513 RepID=A0A9P8AJX2_9ASCO|nr:member of Set1p complex, histone methyl transferase [Scheffersomyces spartinae]KAG7195314.1 member of Set1p complex, histone methyl transferase [Scheffersomyces spartinae]
MSTTLLISERMVSPLRAVKNFNYHKGASITSVDFDDLGQYLISCGIDKSIQVYDIHKGKHFKDVQSQKYGAHLARFIHKGLNCLYASTPGESSAETDSDAIRYLQLADNQYVRYFRGHAAQVLDIQVNPVADTFVSASLDCTVKMWDLRVANATGNINTKVPSIIAYDPHGVVMALGRQSILGKLQSTENHTNNKGRIDFFDLQNYDKGPFLLVELETLPNAIWNKLEFSNNGKLLLLGTDGPEHYVLDAFLGVLLTTILLTLPNEFKPGDRWMRFNYHCSGSVCFTPDGRYIIVGSPLKNILIYDTNNMNTNPSTVNNRHKLLPIKNYRTENGVPKIVAFNPKLFTLAVADNTVTLWQSEAQ